MVAPNGWNIGKWSDVLSGFTSGATPYRGKPDYYRGSVKWVSSGELNYNYITDTIEHITEKAKVDTSLTVHPAGTFLMAITGLEAEGTRGSCAILATEATTNQSCMAIYATNKMDIEFLFHYYIRNGNSLAFEYCQGTKQQSYTAKIVRELPIMYPESLPEQRAIAAALSDTDAYITVLEKLIAKKRAIKQGAMQELLTGKRRLPGFKGEWVEKRIGDIGYSYSGLTGKRKEHFGIGNAQYITFLNVLLNTVIDINILENVNVGDKENQNSVQCGDLFFNTSSETPEEVGMCAVLTEQVDSTYLNSFCFGFRLSDKEIDGLYLSYYFNSNEGRKIMTLLAQGATRYNLSKTHFNDAVLLLPSKAEQTAIAIVLSDMDADIDALTAKLEKARRIKQGMMSELLTGRIRLIGGGTDNGQN